MNELGPLARDILQPAACVDRYATVAQVADAVSHGVGFFVHEEADWWCLQPQRLLGIPGGRRLIDVPLVPVEPVSLLSVVTDATFASSEVRPVADGQGGCLGRVTRAGLAQFQGVVADLVDLRASMASLVHDLSNVLMVAEQANSEADQLRTSFALGEMRSLVHRAASLQRAHPEQLRTFSLDTFLRETARQLAAVAGVRIDVQPCTANAHARPASLRRILLNLCLNAAEVGAHEVRWAVERRGRYVVVVVSDDGPGFQGRERHAFEPGYSTSGGSGLGLPTIRRLVNELGGEVDIRTGQPGGCVAFSLLGREPESAS